MNPAESLRVRIDPHTRERAMERGASIEQIVDVIQTGVPVAAREGRFAREKFIVTMDSGKANTTTRS